MKQQDNLNITPILNWFKQAKPKPTIENISTQIGCHFEEVAEMAAQLNEHCLYTELDAAADDYKNFNAVFAMLENLDKIELLDALCDQIITAIGVAYMFRMDIQGALSEVNRSNWSKFENGKPIFDEQGKIIKGKDYFKPELNQFIGE